MAKIKKKKMISEKDHLIIVSIFITFLLVGMNLSYQQGTIDGIIQGVIFCPK